MTRGGSRRGEAGRGQKGRDRATLSPPVPSFAAIMREQGMTSPAALERAMQTAAPGVDSVEDALRAAEEILDRILSAECASRESALDLLTVDALITAAMKIAARDRGSLAEFPELAMKRIAAK